MTAGSRWMQRMSRNIVLACRRVSCWKELAPSSPRNKSPDVFFNLSINPYRGCEHGCIYCYARPNHGYVGLSPGLDFETRLFAKVNAPELFVAEIGSEGYECEPINIGAVTDPYQPIERQFRITRQLLEVALEHRQPVTLITKGSLVERDLDLLAELSVSATGFGGRHRHLPWRRNWPASWSPGPSAPWRRMETDQAPGKRRRAGRCLHRSRSFRSSTTTNWKRCCRQLGKQGAKGAHYTLIRLPLEVNPLFEQWLQAHYPDRASRVMHRIQDMRDGGTTTPGSSAG
jgi:DNA repair photolyase